MSVALKSLASSRVRTRHCQCTVGVSMRRGDSRMRGIANIPIVAAVIVAVAITSVEGALPLPDFVKACARNDPKLNDCALRNAQPVVTKLKDGLPKYRVPRLEPLKVDEIKVNHDEGATVGIDLVAKDIKIHGLSEAEVRDLKVTLEPPHFWFKFFVPRVEFEALYTVDGKVLILPIKGEGDANITLVGLELSYDFGGEWNKRDDGFRYLKIDKTNMEYKMARVHIRLENLFNGDKALGDRMNEFLDVNWREVTEELGPPIADALAAIIKSIMEGVTDQVPFENIFPESV